MNTPAPSADEKTMAGYCYYGILLCLVPPVLIFVTKKDQSQHLKFHGLQAIGVAIIMLLLWTVVGFIGFVIGFLPVIGPVIAWLLGFALLVAIVITSVKLGMDASAGKPVEIPIVGEIIRKKLMA